MTFQKNTLSIYMFSISTMFVCLFKIFIVFDFAICIIFTKVYVMFVGGICLIEFSFACVSVGLFV